MKIRPRIESLLGNKARRGFRGYPVATVAFYGPDAGMATKVAVGIVAGEGAEPHAFERWFSQDLDLRVDRAIGQQILRFIKQHGARSVVLSPGIVGCPHEEGVDYPAGKSCPRCPYWTNRDRWTGEIIAQ
jgi:hypothetical protein